jgi:hypothetical protein
MPVAFDLESYEPVASRIQRFYEAYPNGAIHCEIVHDDGKRVLVKATVWRDINDAQPSAVDFAEEHLTDRGVNATSRVENACTSATGRAISIAAHGLGPSDWTKKPSREEMGKVQRMTTTTSSDGVITERPANAPSDKQVWLYKKLLKEAGKLPPLDLASWDKFKISKAIEALKNNEPEEIPLPEEEPF